MKSTTRRLFMITALLISSLTLFSKVDSIYISVNDPKCFGGTDGYVTIDSITTTAPSGPYLIRLNSSPVRFPKIGDTITLRNGNFTITIHDLGDGNKLTPRSFSINEPFQLITSTYSTPTTCNGSCDGSADIIAFDGTPPYTYLWSDPLAQTSTKASSLCAKKYYVTVTDAHGCTAIDSVDISQPPQIKPNVTVVDVACFGDSTGSASASPTGGTGTYTKYSWSSSSNNTATEKNLSPGKYTITVTDDDGCSDIENFTIKGPAAPLSTTLSKIDVNCSGGNSGSISNNPAGGTPPYTYSWNDATTTKNRKNIAKGTYIVTITDDNGCAFVDTISVKESIKINSVLSATDALCNGSSSGNITASASGGTPGYTYQWSNSINGATNNNLPAGKYYVTITDAASCTTIDSATVGEPKALQASANSLSNPSCNGDKDGSISILVNGGITPYNYAWNDAVTTKNRSKLGAGTYTLIVTDDNGCKDTVGITLTDPAVLTATIDSTKAASCNGLSDGYARVAPAGGTSPYAYAWSNSTTTKQNNNLSAGTYNVTITDANGCTASTVATITDPSALVASATSTDASCAGLSDGTATANGKGGTKPYTYLWSNADTTAGISNLTAGTYKVTVTDGNGCSDLESVIVKQPTAINISITANNLKCNNDGSGDATAKASGGSSPYTFLWNDENNQTTATANNLNAGKVLVTVTDSKGCSAVDSVTLIEPSPLTASISSSTDPSCNGGKDGSATVAANGGTKTYSYLWSDPAKQTTTTATNLTAGSYTVTVTDKKNCTTTAKVSLTDPKSIVITIDSIKHVNCFGGNDGLINLTTTGGNTPYSFTWNDAATTEDRNNLTSGTYTITVTDSKSCTEIKKFTIKEPSSALKATITSKTDVKCHGDSSGSIDLNVSGGTKSYFFAWNDAVTTEDRNNLKAGNYSVTVTDGNGCTTIANATINESNQLNLSILKATDASCSNTNDGAAQVSASGGTTPYSFNWSNSGGGTNQTNLAAGKYYITITDGNNCQQIDSLTIGSPQPIAIKADSVVDVSCNAGKNGSIEVSASGGNPAYSYAWSNGGNGKKISNLSAGSYTVTATDNKGCTETKKITVSEPKPLAVSFKKTNLQCSGIEDGKLTADPTGGIAPYTYSWGTTATSKSIDSLAAGNYSVTITDRNGCTTTASPTINSANPISLNVTGRDVICNGDSSGSMSASAFGGTGSFTYSWSDSKNGAIRKNISAGTYYVTATDANGCASIDTVTINEPDTLKPNLTTTDASCSGVNNGSATAAPTGGTSPYSYKWSISGNAASVSNLSPGSYSLTITDANGCDSTQSFTINSKTVNFTYVDKLKNNDCFGGCSGTIDIGKLSGGTSPYKYQWSSNTGSIGNASSVSGLCAGTYQLTISDANGCDSVAKFAITEPSQINSFTNSYDESCSPGKDGSATVSAKGGTAPYSYKWTNNKSTDSISGLSPGKYFVTITDKKGCTHLDSVTIGSIPSPSYSFKDSLDHNYCFGDCSGKIEIIGLNGGKAPYTYQWSNSAGNVNSIKNLCAGSYKLTISDANGCDSTLIFNITEPKKLVANASHTDESCTRNDGTATVAPTGGTPPYTYNWSNNQSTVSINGLTAGVYYVTITDLAGCIELDSVKINGKPRIHPNDTSNDVSCFGSCDGSIQFNPTGASTSNYTYNWSPAPPAGQGVSSATNLCAGTYQVTISSNGACDTVVNINIIAPSQLTTIISTVDERCGLTSNCRGEAYASTSGGTAPYSYSWPTGTVSGSNQDTIKNVCPGNYQLTITDANGCSSTEKFTISKPSPISANFNAADATCNSSDGDLDVVASGGTSPYSYQWYDQSLTAISSSDSIIKNRSSGFYYVDITDDNGCTQRFSSSINDIGSETITVNGKDISCNGNCDGEATVFLNCTDPSCSIEWYDATTATPIGVNSSTAKNLCAGKYFVEVTNNSGCKTSKSITIKEPTKFSISEDIIDPKCASVCDGKINLAVSGAFGGPYIYVWSPAPTNGQGTANVSGLCSGTYSVTISNSTLCDTVLIYTINSPAALSVKFTKTEPNCAQSNGSISVIINGGTVALDYKYQWFDGSNNLLAGETNATINNLAAGTYKLSVRDDNNCVDYFTTILGDIDGPKIILDSLQDASCFSNNDGSIEIDVSGGTPPYRYNWLQTGQSTEDIFGLSAGNYTIMITDDANCIATQTFEIKQFNALNASFSTKEASCGQCNGEAKISMSGGVAPFTYLWSNGSTADSATKLCSGLQRVKVTDSVGCSKTFTISINNSDAPTATISTTASSCASSCDGTAKVDIKEGSPPFTYNWMHNNATTNSIGGLCAGDYTVQVTDVKGCSQLIDFTIIAPSEITLEAEIKASICNTTPCDGSILLNTKGGQAPYTFDWGTTSVIDTNYIDNLCAGLYTVNITDANGCIFTKNITLSNNGVPISSQPEAQDENCFGNCDGSLISNLTASSTISFQWLDDKGNAVVTKDNDLIAAACAGVYYLEVTKLPEGCISFSSVTISSPDSIILNPTIIKPISCAGSCDAEVFVSATGGELLFNYSWSDKDQQQTVPAVGLCAGNYTVTATDANGCSASTNIKLIDPKPLSLIVLSTKDIGCSSECNGEATVSGIGGNLPYIYNWSGGQKGNNPTDLCFGPNIVTITDATNCEISDTVYITAADTVIAEVPTNIAFCDGDSIYLNGNPIGSSVTSYGWYKADNTLFTNSKDTTVALGVGSYTYYFTATNGTCSDTAIYKFKVTETPNINMAKSMQLYEDDVKKIIVDGQKDRYTYRWTPDTNLTSATIAEPYTDTRETVFYTLRVLDTTGCATIDSIEVLYSPRIEIPSGFSPNGDGVNDVWKIPALIDFPYADVKVFNRWGELVYKAENGYTDPWDGIFKGEQLPIGTYYYIVDFKSDKFKTMTGPITIIK